MIGIIVTPFVFVEPCQAMPSLPLQWGIAVGVLLHFAQLALCFRAIMRPDGD